MSSDDEFVVRNPFSANADRRTSRRTRLSRDHESKSRALEEMKQARSTGTVRRVNVETLVKPVYEEVDEDEYMDIVRQRQNDNFVVDDDGAGYIDHGRDFSDEDDDLAVKKEKIKKKMREKPKRKVIEQYFSAAVSKRVKKDENEVKLCDDPDVEALLKECDVDMVSEDTGPTNSTVVNVKSSIERNPFKRLSERPKTFSKPTSREQSKPKFSHPVETPHSIGDEYIKPRDVDDESEEIVETSSFDNVHSQRLQSEEPEVTKTEVHTIECPQINPVKDLDLVNVEELNEDKSGSKNEQFHWAQNDVDMDVEEHVSKPDCTVKEKFENKTFISKAVNGRDVLQFYWLDAFEDPVKMPGAVYLFGRLNNGGVSESCCVVVKNIWRRIFFLPRNDDSTATDGKIDFMKVNDEVQMILRSQGVKVVKCKPCEKKFAFNDGVVPQSAQVLEVQYPYTDPKLSVDLVGEKFSKVFNVTTTALERLMIELDFNGPSWMEVTDFVRSSPPVSYSKHEFIVDMERMKSIKPIECEDSIPKVNMLTLNIVSAMSQKKENEIVMISCILDRNTDIEKPNTNSSRLERFCMITKPTSIAYPIDLRSALKRHNLASVVFETSNERHLLNLFLSKLQLLNPDVYVGHDLSSQLSVLCDRLEKLKIAHWSRIGRLKRSVGIKQVARNKSSQWELTAGRLLVDSRTAAMELLRMPSYDLHELASNLLKKSYEPSTTQNFASHYANSTNLIVFVNNGWKDAWLALALIVELNAVPLFIQITQIVGGVLSRTMLGGRAERNEYLLLHAFHKSDFVAPNKYQFDFKKKNLEHNNASAIDEKDETKMTSRSKKAQYAGGLVLDPRIDLYDTYVLLLDFNSLYPSIIQEYNICFTTVDQSHKDQDILPELPTEAKEGILPREIRVLVECRRKVKSMMRSTKISHQQQQQYQIRQMALKLTANSMYGCLGFQQSRFYAKPLAALITSRGREILLHTRDLIEKLGYSVIYGDTDSVMINTGLCDLEQAIKIGNDIKKVINKCHNKLEIDIDGVYSKLLLLKKKKYAGLAVDLNDKMSVKKELKGLDIVRRDWSLIAKDVGNKVVDIILSSTNRDQLVREIFDCLHVLSVDLIEGTLDIGNFEIMKQLTRDPEQYSDTQPHVAVALRLNRSGKFKFHRGDIISYIICDDGSGRSAAQRAYHRTELEESKDMKIDLQYYLSHQIHPVVSRLCIPIEECNAAFIADALGLDASSYKTRAVSQMCREKESDNYVMGMEYHFDHCEPFTFKCPNEQCKSDISVREALCEIKDGKLSHWICGCIFCDSFLLPYAAYIYNQMDLTLKNGIQRYYSADFVCDDIGCAFRTRRQLMNWTRDGVICPKCFNGTMKKEYSARMLFEQQLFYRKIFDVRKVFESLDDEKMRKIMLGNDLRDVLAFNDRLAKLCDQFLESNNYNRVELSYLFANMRSIE